MGRGSFDLRIEHTACDEAAQLEGCVGAAAGNGIGDKVLGAGYIGVDRVAIVRVCPEAVEECLCFAAATWAKAE